MAKGKEIEQVDTNRKMQVFGDDFGVALEMAKCLAASTMVPDMYRNNIANCFVALDLAGRIGASPIAVMQNLYPVKGKIGFEAKFTIAVVNTCGRFSPLRFKFSGGGEEFGCRAVATELRTDEELVGTKITLKMVTYEGWNKDVTKQGVLYRSKWNTMGEQMYKYRAASFWKNEFAPELTMGIPTVDEVRDIIAAEPASVVPSSIDEQQKPKTIDDIAKAAKPATVSVPTVKPTTVLIKPTAPKEQAEINLGDIEPIVKELYGDDWFGKTALFARQHGKFGLGDMTKEQHAWLKGELSARLDAQNNKD